MTESSSASAGHSDGGSAGHDSNSGDAWVEGPDGQRFWGTFGAAGLLTVHPDGSVLLQHRAEWSHFGGTWGLPGGARHQGESATAGATREAGEEAAVPTSGLKYQFSSIFDLGWWSYTTIVARSSEPFTPVISDAESVELRWVPQEDVIGLPLHPGFAARWSELRDGLTLGAHVIVDAANVVGSQPDGWWKDRVGATATLARHIQNRIRDGFPAELLGLPFNTWWPKITLVVEGKAVSLASVFDGIEIVRAPGAGDDTIVAVAREAQTDGNDVTVVTSDRGLRSRIESIGARSVTVRPFLAVVSE